jgi:molybdenum cofactor cytidylyltransferase
VVVTGHKADQVEKVIQHLPITDVVNLDFASGIGGSIAVGVAALPEDVEAVLICLADMPLVHPALIERLCDAYAGGDAHSICVPVWNGRRGHPVLFGRGHFPALGRLSGDHGARGLIEANSACLREVNSPDDTVLQDADTIEELELLRQRFG